MRCYKLSTRAGRSEVLQQADIVRFVSSCFCRGLGRRCKIPSSKGVSVLGPEHASQEGDYVNFVCIISGFSCQSSMLTHIYRHVSTELSSLYVCQRR